MHDFRKSIISNGGCKSGSTTSRGVRSRKEKVCLYYNVIMYVTLR